jgi:hypothetical protein
MSSVWTEIAVMPGFFLKFLTSQISGWVAILAVIALIAGGTFVSKQIYDYKELQRKAAYCEGQLSQQEFIRSLSKRAIDQVHRDAEETIDDIEEERDSGEEELQGCAGKRANESVLRYHGWLPNDTEDN